MEVETILLNNTDTETVKRRLAFQKSFSQEVRSVLWGISTKKIIIQKEKDINKYFRKRVNIRIIIKQKVKILICNYYYFVLLKG